jgi:hypothetical protein
MEEGKIAAAGWLVRLKESIHVYKCATLGNTFVGGTGWDQFQLFLNQSFY